MPSPFPGMNPYLENPDLWPEVHHLLIGLLAETLNPQLLPTYRVAIEKRVYQLSGEDALLIGIPDVAIASAQAKTHPSSVAVVSPSTQPVAVLLPMPIEVQEGYLEVREVATQTVVTVIEVLSPANKRPGRGREAYLQKRDRVLGSHTHLVEIDLLRSGTPMPMAGAGARSDYRILVSRHERRPQAELYPFTLREPIPPFAVPLKPHSQEPMVLLDDLLQRVIERAGLSVVLNYQVAPVPEVAEGDRAWLQELLAQE
ncbi:DUF4058 family protein [Nodosilinea sp. LEGE 07088]|uniref:DUF4058 family protein n=1 Tax=Nodosilinea sp. LEGE 07088 TaxID=2777968 RepID=UPI00187E6E7B|nr:DUF4058 family protein [Nodosilinea sp. LEGE 07088]MBE9140129.1 DUF4058 family protein [Nodosilinea sp. LEGE 07088]